jgi:carotenoid cleavage dioxygenase-like enzyme
LFVADAEGARRLQEPVAFDRDTLETAGVAGYQDGLSGQLTTAHPHQDPATGDLLNYLLHFSRASEYRVYRQKTTGAARERIGCVKAAHPSYMHSFAITGKYVVLAEFPLVVNPLRILLSGRPFIENYRWEPERGTRFTVMDLREDASIIDALYLARMRAAGSTPLALPTRCRIGLGFHGLFSKDG